MVLMLGADGRGCGCGCGCSVASLQHCRFARTKEMQESYTGIYLQKPEASFEN